MQLSLLRRQANLQSRAATLPQRLASRACPQVRSSLHFTRKNFSPKTAPFHHHESGGKQRIAAPSARLLQTTTLRSSESMRSMSFLKKPIMDKMSTNSLPLSRIHGGLGSVFSNKKKQDISFLSQAREVTRTNRNQQADHATLSAGVSAVDQRRTLHFSYHLTKLSSTNSHSGKLQILQPTSSKRLLAALASVTELPNAKLRTVVDTAGLFTKEQCASLNKYLESFPDVAVVIIDGLPADCASTQVCSEKIFIQSRLGAQSLLILYDHKNTAISLRPGKSLEERLTPSAINVITFGFTMYIKTGGIYGALEWLFPQLKPFFKVHRIFTKVKAWLTGFFFLLVVISVFAVKYYLTEYFQNKKVEEAAFPSAFRNTSTVANTSPDTVEKE